MNRRSIFKLLAGAACAAAMEITGLVPSLPKAAKYVVNPEWLNAAYEDVVIFSTSLDNPAWRDVAMTRFNKTNKTNRNVVPQTTPCVSDHPHIRSEAHVTARYNLVNGEYQLVPYYVLES